MDRIQRGAKFWAKVLVDLRNRGLRDILICCCDGLTGLPEAIRSVFPNTVVQTCTVHLIRSAMRFVFYQDRKKTQTQVLIVKNRTWIVNAQHRRRPGQRDAAPPRYPVRAAQRLAHHPGRHHR